MTAAFSIKSTFIRIAAAPLAALALLAACGQQGGASASGAAPNLVLTDVYMGSETAPVTMVEYASFTCRHCRDFWKQEFPRLKAEYIDTGKVRYVYRDYPTDPSFAPMLTGLSRCKGADKYYDVVEDIFTHWADLMQASEEGKAGTVMIAIGERHGMTRDEINACISDKRVADMINKYVKEAQALGATTTPAIFIGKERGPHDTYESFKAWIDGKLGVGPVQPPANPDGSAATTPAAPAAPAPVQ
jgi:protein-disulfide isomerase